MYSNNYRKLNGRVRFALMRSNTIQAWLFHWGGLTSAVYTWKEKYNRAILWYSIIKTKPNAASNSGNKVVAHKLFRFRDGTEIAWCIWKKAPTVLIMSKNKQATSSLCPSWTLLAEIFCQSKGKFTSAEHTDGQTGSISLKSDKQVIFLAAVSSDKHYTLLWTVNILRQRTKQNTITCGRYHTHSTNPTRTITIKHQILMSGHCRRWKSICPASPERALHCACLSSTVQDVQDPVTQP